MVSYHYKDYMLSLPGVYGWVPPLSSPNSTTKSRMNMHVLNWIFPIVSLLLSFLVAPWPVAGTPLHQEPDRTTGTLQVFDKGAITDSV